VALSISVAATFQTRPSAILPTTDGDGFAEMSPALVVVMVSFLAVASSFDMLTRRIPNGWLILGLAVALIWQATASGWSGVANGLAGFGVGLGLMLPGWLLRFTGGGDVKLLAVVGAFVGSPTAFYAFALSIIVGAVIAVGVSVYAWAARGAASPLTRYGAMVSGLLMTGKLAYIRPDKNEAVGRRFPLAPAIALGSIGAALWV